MEFLHMLLLVLSGVVFTTSRVHQPPGKDVVLTSKDDLTGDIIRYIDVDDLLNNDESMPAKRTTAGQQAADTTYNRIIVVPDEDELEAKSNEKELEEQLKRREEEMKILRQLKREEEENGGESNQGSNQESQTSNAGESDQVDEVAEVVVNEEAPSEQGIWAWRGKKELGSGNEAVPAWRGRRKDTTNMAAARAAGQVHNNNHKRASYFTRKMINWMNFNKANLARKSGTKKKSVKRSFDTGIKGKRMMTSSSESRRDNGSERQFLSLSHHTMGKDAEISASARAQFLRLHPSGMGDQYSLRKELMS